MNQPIKFSLLMGVMERACREVNFARENPEMVVSFDTIEREMEERGWRARWNGKVEVGARGRRFWDDTAGDDSACVMFETGCFAFSDEGRFHSWAEIFGSAFVRGSRDSQMGEAISGVYYIANSGKYWVRSASGQMVGYTKEAISLRLRERGLSTKAGKGEALSPLERGFLFIHEHQSVDGVAPFLFDDRDLIECRGQRVVNASFAKVIGAVGEPGDHAEFGEGCPMLTEIGRVMFGEHQWGIVKAWQAHAYQGAMAGKMSRGKALFIAGPPGAGKTFFARVVFGGVMGGSTDASAFLTGRDQFNQNLFCRPVWCIDDGEAATDSRSRQRYSEIVKKVIANDTVTMRGMYQAGVDVPWCGRIIVTMNDDPNSLQMLPCTDLSIMDKIVLVKALPTDSIEKWPSDEDIARELPHYAACLRDLRPDGEFWDPEKFRRYGVGDFWDADLKLEATLSDPSASVGELIEAWRDSYFFQDGEMNGKHKDSWSGTAGELVNMIKGKTELDGMSSIVIRDLGQFGRRLSALSGATDWISVKDRAAGTRSKKSRIYTILRPEGQNAGGTFLGSEA